MTTSRVNLTPNGADFPASNFAPRSSSNARAVLTFDAATDQTAYWTFQAWQGITTPLTLVMTLAMASATTGTVGFQAAIEAITAGDSMDTDSATSFDTVNNSASTTVPGTAGYEFQISITLTNNDGIAAGDSCRIAINRDADGSAITDSATGNAFFISGEIQDAA